MRGFSLNENFRLRNYCFLLPIGRRSSDRLNIYWHFFDSERINLYDFVADLLSPQYHVIFSLVNDFSFQCIVEQLLRLTFLELTFFSRLTDLRIHSEALVNKLESF